MRNTKVLLFHTPSIGLHQIQPHLNQRERIGTWGKKRPTLESINKIKKKQEKVKINKIKLNWIIKYHLGWFYIMDESKMLSNSKLK